MTESFRTETLATDAGEYRIELFYDEDAENPLTNWDHPGMSIRVTAARSSVLCDIRADGDEAAVRALRTFGDVNYDVDAVTRRYDKWRAITGSPWILVTGSGNGYMQSHWWNWSVLVDESASWTDTDGEVRPLFMEPVKAVQDTMDVYERWARGEFIQYDVIDPDEKIVDSLSGIDDEEYALSEAKENVGSHAEKRKILLDKEAEEKIEQANLVGAGFMGLI